MPSLSAEQEAAILALGDIWQMASYGLVWRPKQEHIVRYVDGKMAAKASVLQHRVSVNDEDVLVGGVGGVVTMPAFQGQGHATAALNYMAGYLRDQLNLPFGMLFCRPALVPFYRQFGWQVLEDTVNIQQPQGTISSPIPVMYVSYAKQSWPKGIVNLNSEPW
jgi:GNAT superfamily N-acetyltransferase